MSDSYIIEQAVKLKEEGYDFGKIRAYLSNAGHSNDDISSVFKIMDEREIHDLQFNQRLNTARVQLIASLVLTCAGVIYNLYRFGLEDKIDFIILLIPLSIFVAAYYSFKSIRAKRYTAKSILFENFGRKHRE
ncbi:MAG: hypothetical protein JXQ96_07830 [Cyclobacteriaceae bacterium]